MAALESETAALRRNLARALLETGESPKSPLPADGIETTAFAVRVVAAGTLKQSRNALGRPRITVSDGAGEEAALAPDSCCNGKAPTDKASFRLLLCNDETCEVLLPSGPSCTIRNPLRARSLVELRWLSPPRTVLVVKKPNDARAEQALCRVAAFLAREGLTVLVEPAVHEATEGAGGSASTWAAHEAATLAQRIDFCVSLGGDGTILWAAGLFREGVPPIISYALGSLGFLTPFVLEDHARSLRMVLAGEFAVTLRARLMCRVVRAAEAASAATGEDQAWSGNDVRMLLNEVVVDRGPSHSLVELDCFCDGMVRLPRAASAGVSDFLPTAHDKDAGGRHHRRNADGFHGVQPGGGRLDGPSWHQRHALYAHLASRPLLPASASAGRHGAPHLRAAHLALHRLGCL